MTNNEQNKDLHDQDTADDGGIPQVLGQARHLSGQADYFSGTGSEHVARLGKDHDALRQEQRGLSWRLKGTEREIEILEQSRERGHLNDEELAKYEELKKTAEDIKNLMREMQGKMDKIYDNPRVESEMRHEAGVINMRDTYAKREKKLEKGELPDAFLAIFDTTLAHHMPILTSTKELSEAHKALVEAFKAVKDKRADLMEPNSDKLEQHNDRAFNLLGKLIEEDRLKSINDSSPPPAKAGEVYYRKRSTHQPPSSLGDFKKSLLDGIDKLGYFSRRAYGARVRAFIESKQVSTLVNAVEDYRKVKRRNEELLSSEKELTDKLDGVVLSQIRAKMEEESKDRQDLGHRPQRDDNDLSAMFSRARIIAISKLSGREPVDKSVLAVVKGALISYASVLEKRKDDDGMNNKIAMNLRYFTREIGAS